MRCIKKYFTIWWIPIIFYIIPLVTYFTGHILGSSNAIRYSLNIFLINVIGKLISAAVQIVDRKWYFIIPQILVSAFLFYYATKFFTYGELDFFNARYKIPEDIKCEELSNREIKESELNSNDFKLEGCCGYHTYYASFKPKEKGYLYIKAYEITTNERLSEEYINDWSKVFIEDLGQKFYSGNFTIYEGIGDRYCARIELWYKPNNGKEYMVKQKNYIVEGKD